jgi:multiple sugar transport system permease protein
MSKSKGLSRKHQDWLWGYFFVFPTFFGLCALNIYPIFKTLYMSFGTSGMFGKIVIDPNNVFGNYTRLFQDPEVWYAIRNTLVFTFISVPIGIVLAVVLASLMSQQIKGVGVYRVLYFMPVVAAPAAITMVWKLMYNEQYGVINTLIRAVGGPSISWLNDTRFCLLSCAIVAVWSGLGQQIIIMIGAITGVSKSYYEAADIDGASGARKLWSITVPLVSPSIFFILITGMIGALKQFDIVYMLYGKTNGVASVMNAVRTIMHKYYEQAFTVLDKAYASALVMVAFVIIMIFTIIQFVAQKKWVYYDN